MTPERWQEIKKVLAGALERTPEERRVYLDQACTEPALRREVESLIAAHEQRDSSFMERPAMGSNEALKPGTKLGPYEIVARIGAGGMGEVYQAHDTKLGRKVAIKVLPAAFVNNPARLSRFQREARILASLNHPNIATIHGLEESGGVHYLVMELIPGQTLAERLGAGPLDIAEALAISRQIAEALEAAHEQGVIHRDLKPANVKVTPDGRVKVLDFGLAKAFAGERGVDLSQGSPLISAETDEGTILGTPAYMSPEQMRSKPVDKRTDIWAFGCVLYELFTARRAFRGETLADIFAAVLKGEPDWQALPPSTPARMQDLLRHCLQKDSQHRLRDFGDARIEIEEAVMATMMAGPSVKGDDGAKKKAFAKRSDEQPSILVLPFANLYADKMNDYFSDGLTEEVISDLSTIRALRVISRTSTMRLKEAPQDIKRIMEELHVQYILEGSVRKSGNNLRVTAKLLDVLTDSVVWADTHSGTLEDVFTIQEALSKKIVEVLKLKLSSEEELKLAEVSIPDIRAYEYYLKARQEILSYSKEGLERALDYLQSGIKIVGENILLISALGQTYWQFVNAGVSSDPSYLEKAQKCAERILALDSRSPHGYRLLGLVQVHRGNSQEGARLLKRSLATDPNDSDTLAWLIAIYGFSGKPYAAAPLAKKLMEIDPLTPSYQYLPGLLALMAGEFHRALAPFAKALQMEPSNPMTQLCYGQVLALSEHPEESNQIFDALFNEMPESFAAKMGLLYKYALQGDRARALVAATTDLKDTAAGDPYYSWNVAQCFALINAKEEAFDWLEKAISLGFINYPLLARWDPFLENVRSERRFGQLMEKVRERWEAFEV